MILAAPVSSIHCIDAMAEWECLAEFEFKSALLNLSSVQLIINMGVIVSEKEYFHSYFQNLLSLS